MNNDRKKNQSNFMISNCNTFKRLFPFYFNSFISSFSLFSFTLCLLSFLYILQPQHKYMGTL